ncbi:MAG: mandelate racemase/muconate lactonizing enzyme family protein [Halorubrum sp.]
MEIVSIERHHLVHELDGSWAPAWTPGSRSTSHEVDLFAVHTDEDITGYTAMPSFPGGGLDIADGYEAVLKGEDPREIESILRKLDTIDFLGADAWHLELAMWDILGKHLGAPVYRLLGGDADPIPVYSSTGECKPAEDRVTYVEQRVNEGYEAVKLRFQSENIKDDLQVARYVREEFPELTLMVDANMGWSMRFGGEPVRWTAKEALRVARELESLEPIGWLEEPLGMHEYERLAELRRSTSIPIAGGESVNGIEPLQAYLKHGSLDVLQPDALFATGIRRGKTVGDWARAEGLEFAPHTWSNGLGLAANLHVMAATETDWCEFPHEPPFTPAARDFFLTETLRPENGKIEPPKEPGLGVEIDWDAVAKAKVSE